MQVENEILRVYEQQLLEKENSGVSALLRDDKVRRCQRCCLLCSQQRRRSALLPCRSGRLS